MKYRVRPIQITSVGKSSNEKWYHNLKLCTTSVLKPKLKGTNMVQKLSSGHGHYSY